MRVPFGWVALLVGVFGIFITVSRMIMTMAGKELESTSDFTLLAASVAAFVAGWVACVSIPRLERRLDRVLPTDSALGSADNAE